MSEEKDMGQCQCSSEKERDADNKNKNGAGGRKTTYPQRGGKTVSREAAFVNDKTSGYTA